MASSRNVDSVRGLRAAVVPCGASSMDRASRRDCGPPTALNTEAADGTNKIPKHIWSGVDAFGRTGARRGGGETRRGPSNYALPLTKK
jgi:hypothetical protein